MSGLCFGGGSIGSFAGCDGDGCDDCDCGDCDCDCGDCSCPDCDCDCDCNCDCCARCCDEICFRCLSGLYHCVLEGCENTVCCCICDTSTTNDRRDSGRHDSCHDDDIIAMGMVHQYNHEPRSATTGGAQVPVVQTQQPGKVKDPKKKKEKKEGDENDNDEAEGEIDGEEYERRVMEGEEVIQPLNGAVNEVQENFEPPLKPDDVKVDLSISTDEDHRPYPQAGSSNEPKTSPGETSGQRTLQSTSTDYETPSHASGASAPPQEAPSVDTNYPTVAPPSYNDVVTSQPESRDDVV